MNVAEQDLRGEVALAIMAYLTWAEFHGGATPLLDGTVDRWLCAGRPHDPQIARALTNTHTALARYVGSDGRVPEWLPASLLGALKEPASDGGTDALPGQPATGMDRKGAA